MLRLSIDVFTNPFDEFGLWDSFRKSRLFTRGWTLQELLAPASVQVFSAQYEHIGDKSSLARCTHEISGIPSYALQGCPLRSFSIAERLAWTNNRQTSKEEDIVYCLQGIFDITMPLIYGEGVVKAQRWFNKEIDSMMLTRNRLWASCDCDCDWMASLCIFCPGCCHRFCDICASSASE
jgi:hypothetical protein